MGAIRHPDDRQGAADCKSGTHLAAEKAKIDASLSETQANSLCSQKAACQGRIKACRTSSTRRTSEYQAYQEALKAWEQQKETIEGAADKADTLKYYEAQIKYIKEQLPGEIAALQEQRHDVARKVHESIAAIRMSTRSCSLPCSS